MAKGKKWTQKEIDIIKKFYPTEGIYGCLKYLIRPKQSITKKARELGIRRIYQGRNFGIYKKDVLIEIVKESKSFADVARKMNMTPANGYLTIKKYILHFKINTSHFNSSQQHLKNLASKNKIPLNEMLVENSTCNRSSVKNKLIKEKILIEECNFCKQNTLWYGKKISLILDHINGIRNDNRIENLRLLCPNCNATLDTHCGKHLKIIHKCIVCSKHISNKSNFCRDCFIEFNNSDLIKNRINLVKDIIVNKSIDFSKMGWVTALSKKIDLFPQKINLFMKKHFKEFYEKKCFKKCTDRTIAIQREKNIKIHKQIIEQEREERKQIILNSEIDFTKRGWITQLAKKLNINKTSCLKWLKRNMNEFYLKYNI